jgi:hypothetical protein
MATRSLYRPVGPQELALIMSSGWKEFPPRLPEQPIFYPVITETHAVQIARDWNVKSSGAGYVTQFAIEEEYVSSYPVKDVGDAVHKELWVPARELAEFNQHIIGRIFVTQAFLAEATPARPFISQYGTGDESAIRFAWNGKHGDQFRDDNYEFRKLILSEVLAKS